MILLFSVTLRRIATADTMAIFELLIQLLHHPFANIRMKIVDCLIKIRSTKEFRIQVFWRTKLFQCVWGCEKSVTVDLFTVDRVLLLWSKSVVSRWPCNVPSHERHASCTRCHEPERHTLLVLVVRPVRSNEQGVTRHSHPRFVLMLQ